MKVKELQELLKLYGPDDDVIISCYEDDDEFYDDIVSIEPVIYDRGSDQISDRNLENHGVPKELILNGTPAILLSGHVV